MSENRVALMTGANKGIGYRSRRTSPGIVLPCSSARATLGTARLQSRGSATRLTQSQLEVTDQKSIAAAAERIRSEFGWLDVLINNAGIVGEFPAAHHLKSG